VLLAIALCAVLLRGGHERAAAGAAAATLIDPHVGLAVALGVAVHVPRARPALACCGLALAAVSLTALGPDRNWEYVREILPMHALVNVPEFSQYSAANLAFTAGVAPKVALAFGDLWYAAALTAGIMLAGALRARLGGAAVALVPVACAVFGGPYAHVQQLGLAIPAFLLVTTSLHGVRRTVCAVATFAACTPWLFAAPIPYAYAGIGVLAVAFVRRMDVGGAGLATGAAAFALLVLLCIAVVHSHGSPAPAIAATVGNPPADVAWGAFVAANFVPPQLWYLLAKLPTLAAFATMYAAFVDAACRRSAHPAGEVAAG
jgi:hypothetical protein